MNERGSCGEHGSPDADTRPRLALVTDSDLSRRQLQSVLTAAGYDIVLSLNSATLRDYFLPEPGAASETQQATGIGSDSTQTLDAWLVDVDEGHIQQAMSELIDHSSLPLLLIDAIPPQHEPVAYELWKRRLLEKLEVVAIRCENDAAPATTEGSWAKQVWVLVASLGGPDAVKRFLQQLPPGLPIAMVYGQHIEENFDRLLAEALGSQKNYSSQLMQGETQLDEGIIGIVPADRQLRFLPRGRVVATRKSWSGQYQPALDQVISELARIYRHNLGVIVFSGMCNDGEIGCRVARACGATVWAQTPDSCLSPAMPEAAIATGCVSRQGTAEELADALAELITSETSTKYYQALSLRALAGEKQ